MNFPEYVPIHGPWWSPLLFILGVPALAFTPIVLGAFFIELRAKGFKARVRRVGLGAASLVHIALAATLVISLVNFTHAYNANKKTWAEKVVTYVSTAYGLELEHDDIYKFASGDTVTVTDKETGKPLLVQLRNPDSKQPELIGADASTLKRIDR